MLYVGYFYNVHRNFNIISIENAGSHPAHGPMKVHVIYTLPSLPDELHEINFRLLITNITMLLLFTFKHYIKTDKLTIAIHCLLNDIFCILPTNITCCCLTIHGLVISALGIPYLLPALFFTPILK